MRRDVSLLEYSVSARTALVRSLAPRPTGEEGREVEGGEGEGGGRERREGVEEGREGGGGGGGRVWREGGRKEGNKREGLVQSLFVFL